MFIFLTFRMPCIIILRKLLYALKEVYSFLIGNSVHPIQFGSGFVLAGEGGRIPRTPQAICFPNLAIFLHIEHLPPLGRLSQLLLYLLSPRLLWSPSPSVAIYLKDSAFFRRSPSQDLTVPTHSIRFSQLRRFLQSQHFHQFFCILLIHLSHNTPCSFSHQSRHFVFLHTSCFATI